MRVTGERRAAGTTEQHDKKKAPPKKQRGSATWFEDGFDAPVKKVKKPKGKTPPKLEATPALLAQGKATVERHRASGDGSMLADVARALAGLTASVVVGVLHQCQSQPDAATERGIQQLGELTGALFVEYLATHVQPDTLAAVGEVVKAVDDFGQRFEASFGMSPFEATRRFVDFIASTEGQPQRRLAGTLYAR